MTVYEIKDKLGSSTHYFDRDTLRFFGQTLSMFKVRSLGDGQYHVYAPSYWQGRYMGTSQRVYNATTNSLEDVPPDIAF